MGSFLSKSMGKVMDENMKKTQEFMLKTQKMQLERQMAMQQEMRKRGMAQQLGMARESFYWWSGFYSLALIGLTAGFIKMKNPLIITPLIPLSFVVGYQADLVLGNKMERILVETDKILEKEQQILRLPGEPLTVELVDRERLKQKAN